MLPLGLIGTVSSELIVLNFTLVLDPLDKRRHLCENLVVYAVAEPASQDGQMN